MIIKAASLTKILSNITLIRMNNIYDNDLKNTEEYKEMSDQASDILKKLKNILDVNTFKQVIEFCDAKNKMEITSNNHSYQQGFIDGVKSLLSIIDVHS
ncbi:MAG: DUF6809 family protein [Ignavibacteriales bacterium]